MSIFGSSPSNPSKWNAAGCVHILDHEVDWDEHDGIKSAVTGLLSSGLSGYSLEHSDIGGKSTLPGNHTGWSWWGRHPGRGFRS